MLGRRGAAPPFVVPRLPRAARFHPSTRILCSRSTRAAAVPAGPRAFVSQGELLNMQIHRALAAGPGPEAAAGVHRRARGRRRRDRRVCARQQHRLPQWLDRIAWAHSAALGPAPGNAAWKFAAAWPYANTREDYLEAAVQGDTLLIATLDHRRRRPAEMRPAIRDSPCGRRQTRSRGGDRCISDLNLDSGRPVRFPPEFIERYMAFAGGRRGVWRALPGTPAPCRLRGARRPVA